MMGAFWVVGHPLFLMLIYVYMFAVVFQTRIGGTADMPLDYTVYMLSGLVPWLSILPVMTGGCVSILSNVGLVKQFQFEVEVLPVKDVFIAMVFWVVGILIVAVYTLALELKLPWTYVLLPVVLAIHVVLLIGCAWLLSAVSVFFRDLKDIMTVWATLGVYLLPIVYLPQWVPQVFKPIIYSNPLSAVIWIYQDVLFYGRIEHPLAWPVSILFAFFMFTTGHRVFQRLRPMFGNAL
jgi:lipopolysaccharide transport system permease protein